MTLRNVDKTFSLEEQRQEINEIAVDLDAINTTLTNLNAAQWDSAYSWGDHALAGYWVDDSASRTNWDTAYGWGDHGSAGYWLDDSASRTNWDSAYGWGDHGSAGYAADTNVANWDSAYGWGDHALSGYATTTDVNTAVTNSSDWDTAHGWGDHAQAGYLTSYTETQTLDDVLTQGASTTQDITTTGDGSFGKIGVNCDPSAMLEVKGTVTAGDGNNEDLQRWNISSDNVKAEIEYIDTAADRGMLFGTTTDHVLAFQTNNTEKLRITSGGNVLCGGAAVSQTNRQLVVGSNAEANLVIETHNSSASETANIRFYRSRGTAASPTTLVDNDTISQLIFYPHNGTDYANSGAVVKVECDGTIASNSTPVAMSFFTNGGSTSATERFRIKSNGDLKHTGLRAGGGDNKLAILVTPSHNTNEEDVIVYQVENESSFNQITFGGGTSNYNAATTLAFNTAAIDTTGGVRALAIDSSQNILYYGATGSTGGPGGANVTKRADVNANGSLNIEIPGVSFVGHLYVMSVYNANATLRTSRIYLISGRYGNSSVVTELQTDNGSNGGRGFTITDISAGSSNLIQFTDTSNSSVEVSMHFVGAIGL